MGFGVTGPRERRERAKSGSAASRFMAGWRKRRFSDGFLELGEMAFELGSAVWVWVGTFISGTAGVRFWVHGRTWCGGLTCWWAGHGGGVCVLWRDSLGVLALYGAGGGFGCFG